MYAVSRHGLPCRTPTTNNVMVRHAGR
jgi:hypothetical protein